MLYHLLPDELLTSILEFLDVHELARCQQVSRKFSKAASRCLQRDEWNDQLIKYNSVCNRRHRMRQQENEADLLLMDKNLSHALSTMIRLSNPKPLPQASLNKLRIENINAILGLLNAGAIVSELNEFAENFATTVEDGYLTDDSFLKIYGIDLHLLSISKLEKMLRVMEELICSPSTSWQESMTHPAPTFGMPLPCYLMRLVLRGTGGDMVVPTNFKTTVVIRLKGLRVLRLMIYCFHQNTQKRKLFIEWLWSESSLKSSDYLNPVTKYFVEQTTSFLLRFYPRHVVAGQNSSYYELSMGRPLCSNNISQCVLMIPLLSDPLNDKFWPWDELLKRCWRTKETNQIIRHLVATNRVFRLGILLNGLPSLCRRKDRKMIELLFRLEPYFMLRNKGADGNLVSNIIAILNRTRGKTERLIEYMTAIKNTDIQKRLCMKEILEQGISSNNL